MKHESPFIRRSLHVLSLCKKRTQKLFRKGPATLATRSCSLKFVRIDLEITSKSGHNVFQVFRRAYIYIGITMIFLVLHSSNILIRSLKRQKTPAFAHVFVHEYTGFCFATV